MPLSVRHDMPPFITDENGHIPTTDGSVDWLVIVTREAMEDAGCADDISIDWLTARCDLFVDVATYKLEHGRAGEEATIWVQSEDMQEWRATRRGDGDGDGDGDGIGTP